MVTTDSSRTHSMMHDLSMNQTRIEKLAKANEEQQSSVMDDGNNTPSLLSSMSPEKRIETVNGTHDNSEKKPPYLDAPPSYLASTAIKVQGLQSEPDFDKVNSRENIKYTKTGPPEMSHRSLEERLDFSDPRGWWHQSLDYIWCHRGRLILLLTAMLIGIIFVTNTSRNMKEKNKPVSSFQGSQPDHIDFPEAEPAYSESGHRKAIKFSFQNPSDFTFQQLVRNSDNHHASSLNYVRTTGEIHVKPTTGHLESDIKIDIVLQTSDSRLTDLTSIDQTDSSITIETANQFTNSHSSIYISATIWVSPGFPMQNFRIKTHSLSLTFHNGLTLNAATRLNLSTTSGNIQLPRNEPTNPTTTIYSRDVIIETSSGSVKGTYPLFDLLSITTLSGTIEISLDLKPASTDAPKPASLILSTNSASIHVDTPAISSNLIPTRDYKTQIRTQSGSITATLLHGTSTTLHAISGRLHASLYPHSSNPDPHSDLSSHTVSGATNLTLHPSLSHPASPIRKLFATHRVVSGSLLLTYPPRWEGTIVGATASGSLRVEWEGVRVISDRDGYVGRRILAKRGEGEGRLDFEGVSGSALLRGGV